MFKIVHDPDSGEIIRLEICRTCEGLGYYEVYINDYDIEDHPCRNCNGTGEIELDN